MFHLRLHLSCLCKTKTQDFSLDEYCKWEISSFVNLLLKRSAVLDEYRKWEIFSFVNLLLERSAVLEKNVQILLVWGVRWRLSVHGDKLRGYGWWREVLAEVVSLLFPLSFL